MIKAVTTDTHPLYCNNSHKVKLQECTSLWSIHTNTSPQSRHCLLVPILLCGPDTVYWYQYFSVVQTVYWYQYFSVVQTLSIGTNTSLWSRHSLFIPILLCSPDTVYSYQYFSVVQTHSIGTNTSL